MTLKAKHPIGSVLALAVAAVCFGFPSPALSMEDPFQFEAGRWMSSKTYNENVRRNIIEPEASVADEEQKEQPFVAEVQIAPPAVATPLASSAAATEFLMPAMPGMNKGYELRTTSTQETEDKKIRLFASSLQAGTNPPEAKWKTPSAKNLLAQQQEDEDLEYPPLNIRMSFLPARNIPPPPSPALKSAPEKGHDLLRQMAEIKKKESKTPEEAAACAALEAYKKQQIDAIQRDRETLAALREAIHSLGLEKELDFMTEKGSALSTSANQTPVPLDAQPTTTVR